METNNIQFFYCYDRRLQRYLAQKGIKYETHALSIREHFDFYQYLKTKELEIALDSWKKSGKCANFFPKVEK